jgi:hypothetical protein
MLLNIPVVQHVYMMFKECFYSLFLEKNSMLLPENQVLLLELLYNIRLFEQI